MLESSITKLKISVKIVQKVTTPSKPEIIVSTVTESLTKKKQIVQYVQKVPKATTLNSSARHARRDITPKKMALHVFCVLVLRIQITRNVLPVMQASNTIFPN